MVNNIKYKLPLLVLGFVCLSLTVRKQSQNFDREGMILVVGGTFTRGIDSVQLQYASERFNLPVSFFLPEYPQARYSVQSFYLDKYEVTNIQFQRFIDANPRWSKKNIPDSLHDGNYLKDWDGNKYPKSKAYCPVVYVCFNAAVAYAIWEGKRLPSEAEWEFVARGADHKPKTFPWGDADADARKANYVNSGVGHISKIGSYPPNDLGFYDLSGNVWELCLNVWRDDSYQVSAGFGKMLKQKDAAKLREYYDSVKLPPGEIKRVIRGGGWSSNAVDLRTTSRMPYSMTRCTDSVGFRCAANFTGKLNLSHQ